MFCLKCGAKIEGEGKFCPNCGTTVNDGVNQETVVNEETSVVSNPETNEEMVSNEVVGEVPNTISAVPVPVEVSAGPSIFYKGIVLCVGICTLVAIVLILKGVSYESYDSYIFYYKFSITTVLAFALGLLNVSYSKLYDTERYKSLSVFGMSISTIAFGVMALQLWGVMGITSEILIKTIYSMLIASAAIFHATFILTIDSENDLVNKFSSAAKLLIILTFGFLIFNIFAEFSGGFYTKVFYIVAILAAFTTIAAQLLDKSE